MKTQKKVIAEHPEYEQLIRSIVRTVGKNCFPDIYQYGANGGFPGLTMTVDCMALAWRNREQIRALLEAMCDDLGEDIGASLQSWPIIGKDFRPSELVRAVYISHKPRFSDDAERTVWDALPKFAAEEIARWFCEEDR